MNRLAASFLDLLYPRHCPGCGEILRSRDRDLCPACRKTLDAVTDNYCLKCGRPVKAEEEYCRECREHRYYFTAGRSVFPYTDRWKRSLERYKYYGYREFGDFYARAMTWILKKELPRWKTGLIVPVPLSPRKRRRRGFDQSRLLAEKISLLTGIPADFTLVRKVRETKSQKKLTRLERRQNLRGAFSVERRIDGITVLVIDDVYTTGSTVNEMARILLAAGARDVYFLTLCTGTK